MYRRQQGTDIRIVVASSLLKHICRMIQLSTWTKSMERWRYTSRETYRSPTLSRKSNSLPHWRVPNLCGDKRLSHTLSPPSPDQL